MIALLNMDPNENQQQLRELVRMRRRGIFIYALPNLITSANLFLGFLSITFSIDEDYEKAAWAIIFAALFDLLDGRVARMTKTTSRFGIELDSLCDLISFGLAPSLLLYIGGLKDYGRLGIAVTLIFTLCGALRLARFNVFFAALPKSYFQGLPIPIASATIATMIFFSKEVEFAWQESPWTLLLVTVLGMLMISTIRFPSFKDIHLRHRRSFHQVVPFILILLSLVLWFEVSPFILLSLYITISLGLDVFRYWKRKETSN